jgi:uncharacterized protein DUF2652/polyketide cyclase/dehydrase/lipid transport protein
MDGILVIADISGYTRYLTGVELEHSQDILADIIGLIAEQLGRSLTVEQLEGDAVFCYQSDGERLDLLATIEECYVAFADRLRSIYRLSTCDCRACRSVPMLDLKFVAHHGTFLEQLVAGRHSLLGPDVILIHRLLKNEVSERTGIKGYALLTDDCVGHARIDPTASNLIPHAEDYDVGHVSGWVRNLERLWRERREAQRVYLDASEALVSVEREVVGSAEMLWNFVAVPANQIGWLLGLDQVEEHNPAGGRGIGTVSHCIHGDVALRHEVLDWHPPQYLTERIVGTRIGSWIVTAELTPVDELRTLCSWRMRLEIPPETADEALIAAAVTPVMAQSLENLAARAAEGNLELRR